MDLFRHVIVFDALDIDTESRFWAGIFEGSVVKDSDGKWHSVIDRNNKWVIGIQFAPNHVRPNWPNGERQQVHLDFHVCDFAAAHSRVMELGAELLQATSDLRAEQGFQVYADPAGHPFCLGWGHPKEEELQKYLSKI
jgi:predicted enzyme related to lactoylglutathione lyase